MNIFEIVPILDNSRGLIKINGKAYECALGKSGVINAHDKREGDNKTPIGSWKLETLFYRADKIPAPISPYTPIIISTNDGWCDASEDENYNRFVSHPYKVSAEKLWRDDGAYDIIFTTSHNQNPIVKNMGSAIFLHCAKENYTPTEGCVALKYTDLLILLENCTGDDYIKILSLPE